MGIFAAQPLFTGTLVFLSGLFMVGLGLWGRRESETNLAVAADTPEDRKRLVNLLDNMKRYLKLDDIQEVCFTLGIEYEDLPGETRQAKARELIIACQQRDKLDELIVTCSIKRPNVSSWTESSWVNRFRPTLTRSARIIMGFSGLIQVGIGLTFLFTTAPPPPVALMGARFMTGNWDPRQIDFSTAATNGIPVSPNLRLQFMDIEISVPRNAPQYSVRAEIYSGDTRIGYSSEPVPLLDGQILAPLDIVSDYQDERTPTAWLVQPAWKILTMSIVVERNGRAVARTNYDIRLNPTGDAWYLKPPTAQFAAVSYSINDSNPLVLDLRELDKGNGIQISSGDTLTIHEIWYHAAEEVLDNDTIQLESHLSLAGDYNFETERKSTPVALEKGVHVLLATEPISWVIPDGHDQLVLWLVRDDRTVLDKLYIPLKSQATAGLIPVEEANSIVGNIPRLSLLGVSFEIGDYNPRLLDLRANPPTLPVGENSLLELSGIWVTSDQAEPGLWVWAEIYEDSGLSQLVGHTEPVKLTADRLQLEEVLIDNYADSEVPYDWRIPPNWKDLYILIAGQQEGQEVTNHFDTEHIQFDKESSTWLSDSINASIASIAYEVNGGPTKLLDMRTIETSGMVATPGDTITITDLWYHFSPTHREIGKAQIEAHLSKSGSYEGETRKVTPLETLQKGFHPSNNITELSWTIPEGFDLLYLSLTNENGEIVDRLSIPISAVTGLHLVPAETAIQWPFNQVDYFDFEDESEMDAISGFSPFTEVSHSHAEAFSGEYSIAVTTTLSQTQFVEWRFPFQADVIALQVYWPENSDFTVRYAQVCPLAGGPDCWSIPTHQGQWNTFTMNLFAPANGNSANTLSEWTYDGLYIQGNIEGVDIDHPYTFYVDGIQISPAQ